jgi:hypothetical protein
MFARPAVSSVLFPTEGPRSKLKKALPEPMPGSALTNDQAGVSLAAALAFLIGAASASAAAVGLKSAVQLESIHVEIDLYRFGALEKIFVDDKLKTVHIELLIRVIGLIQSHGQAGATSAAFIEEDPNGTDFLAIEIGRDLLTGRRCNFEHDVLLTSSRYFTRARWTADGRMALHPMPLFANATIHCGVT